MAANASFDELRWVIQIRRTLDDHHGGDNADADDVPVSIFGVPKTLMSTHPDSYTPQQVALGPYHHWRPELYEMERFKLAAAKRTQEHLLRRASLRFQTLVDEVALLDHQIRSCYHRFLDFSAETLAWMMAMDASFLLEFLHVYAVRHGSSSSSKLLLSRVSSRLSHLVDYAGQKSAHNAILRDAIMLENQLPMFVLRRILEFQHPSVEVADDLLAAMAKGFCSELSPFKMINEDPFSGGGGVWDAAHLLDLLYRMIVPRIERSSHPDKTLLQDDFEEICEDEQDHEVFDTDSDSYLKKMVEKAWEFLCFCCLFSIKRLLRSKPVNFTLKLPLVLLSRFPWMSIFVSLCSFPDEEAAAKSENENKPPLVEEITIPSVSELAKSGFRFAPTSGGISSVSFDPKMVTLRLPIVSLDVNSGVVLRNLVAYEAAGASGPLLFTRYTELMNGIIDTDEDARILRERGVILNRLKSDQEVADLWNGMSKSIRLTRVGVLDKVIEDVNKYYDGRWSVRVGKFMKRYVFGSWQLLTLLAVILLLLLMSLQAVFSVYNFTRSFHYITAAHPTKPY